MFPGFSTAETVAAGSLCALTEIAYTEIDPYTLEPLNILIKQNFEQHIPYFVATWERANRKILADAASFIQSYYKFGHLADPETQLPIGSFKIYKITPKSRKFFSDQNTTVLPDSENTEAKYHKTKYIGACNPNETEKRGEKRYYMTIYFAEKAEKMGNSQKCWENATKWLNLAIGDKNLDARLRKVQWHENGSNPSIMHCYHQATKEMWQLAFEPGMPKETTVQFIDFLVEMLEGAAPYKSQKAEIDACVSYKNQLLLQSISFIA